LPPNGGMKGVRCKGISPVGQARPCPPPASGNEKSDFENEKPIRD
jgi:hypothetical protein